jgi:phenylpropionate dioxygenase-like ring-hydroxylating dioxygenase large terminal subunit
MKVIFIIILQLLTKSLSFKPSITRNKLIYKAANDNNIFFSLEKFDEDSETELKNKNFGFGKNPRLVYPNENGQLTWYPIGFSSEFKKNIKQFPEIRKKRYVVWCDDNRKFYALRDACCHMGSSFKGGKNNGCLISCPYHDYTFNGASGNLIDIPFMDNIPSLHISNHKVIEKNGIIYLNTAEGISNEINDSKILEIPEEYKKGFRSVNLKVLFLNGAEYVTCNSADIRHISTVHSFGNKDHPEPIIVPNKIKQSDFHYKITYSYIAGNNSIVKKLYKTSNIIVESEFKLPHGSVARVIFGNFTSVIYIQATPISDITTIAYVKAIRNYWVEDDEKGNIFHKMYAKIINYIGDKITENTMIETLKQDAEIIANLDEHEKNKFNFATKSDTLPFLYMKLYKRLIH